jgi:hypothetical protein
MSVTAVLAASHDFATNLNKLSLSLFHPVNSRA